jgi:hypothetical protein
MRPWHPRLLVISLLLALSATAQIQPTLSNNDVIRMVSQGFSDDAIIEKFHTVTATNFDTSVTALKVLKAAKVSDAVLKVMINSHGSPNSLALPGWGAAIQLPPRHSSAICL